MLRFLNLPDAASAHAAAIDATIGWVHWLMLLLFVGWGIYFLFVLFRFSAKRNPKANPEGVKSKISTWVEGAVIVAEAVLLLGFSIPLWAERVEAFPDAKDATVVRVVGEQFAWNIHYPGPDGVFGRTSPELINLESNPLGLDYQDERAKDDVTTVNLLHFPVEKPVIIYVSSKDVIHSFALQEFRIKQDTIPGMSIPLWFQPTVTTAEMREIKGDPEYNYEISCAQLCGLGHYRMRGFVTVTTQAEFDAWFAEQAELQGGGEDFWN